MENKLVSVIVPVYKAEKYLDRCVESIVSQTYKNLEIILVDDGSPDNCPQLCDSWAEKDSRITVIHKENGGAASARTAGINKADGAYVGFVDADDWIEKDMYAYLITLADAYNAQVACAAFRDVDIKDTAVSFEDNNPELLKIYDFKEIIKYMNADCLWSMCNKIYARVLFEYVPALSERLSFSEDAMYNYFLYKNTNKLIVSNKIKYNYFRHEESAIAGCITYPLIDDSMLAYKIIDDDFDKNSDAYPYAIANKVKNDMFLINSVIRNQKCLDRYQVLRKDILKYKKYIFDKKYRDVYCFRHRFGVFLLQYAPKIYDQTILIRRGIRGY